MTTLTVNIDNKKSEKAVKALFDALGLSYSVDTTPANIRPLNKAEKHVLANLKQSLSEIKLHQEGKIELRDARALLDEL